MHQPAEAQRPAMAAHGREGLDSIYTPLSLTCRDCGEAKPLEREHWYPDTAYRSGFFTARCRLCERPHKREKERQARSRDPVRARYGNQHPPTVNSLSNARQRCHSPKPQDGPAYAGIEYRLTYAAVIAAIGPRPPGTSIDRIDSRGHYEIGNVRWATADEQSSNRIFRPKGRRKKDDAGPACCSRCTGRR